ncbi:MAG: putative zinc-binding protein [Acidobacteriia bacterium]|nr:putative zinc-binding protein [Terriglobia bacterium]
MPRLPERKVGIVACSCEELAEGTVTRLAALKVLHELRPGKTVTICLPLFLAGGEGDRAFARFHPTITLDGCDLRCAARGTEMHSGKPAASIVVNDIVAEHGLSKVEGRRQLNASGREAVNLAAQRLTELVDKILGPPALIVLNNAVAEAGPQQAQSVGCTCGSGNPTQKICIDGKTVELLALPLIFKHLHQIGRSPEAAAEELLEAVKIYNSVPPEQEKAYREAMVREYAAFCQEAKP